ncbi:unnamed protein product [Closterium sp. Naga37s-1]|nr:unnamed protein product [Closterium sp. Naga37s-1]
MIEDPWDLTFVYLPHPTPGPPTRSVLNFMGLVGNLSPELSALSALTTIDLGMNLFNVELSDFVAPLLQIKSVAYIINSSVNPHVSACASIVSSSAFSAAPSRPFSLYAPQHVPPLPFLLSLLSFPLLTPFPFPLPHLPLFLSFPPPLSPTISSLASNYLTGVLPSPPSVALKTLDVSGNFFAGSFPSFASQLDECSAGGNCLSSSGHCSSGEGAGGEQRGEEACAVCGGSMKSMQVNPCGEGRVCVAEMDTVPESEDEARSVTVTMVCQDVSAAEEDTGNESDDTDNSEEEDNESGASSGSGASEDGAKSGADSGSEEGEGGSEGGNAVAGSEDKDGEEDEDEGEEEGNVEEGEDEEEESAVGEKGGSGGGDKGSAEESSGASHSDGSAKTGEEGGTGASAGGTNAGDTKAGSETGTGTGTKKKCNKRIKCPKSACGGRRRRCVPYYRSCNGYKCL